MQTIIVNKQTTALYMCMLNALNLVRRGDVDSVQLVSITKQQDSKYLHTVVIQACSVTLTIRNVCFEDNGEGNYAMHDLRVTMAPGALRQQFNEWLYCAFNGEGANWEDITLATNSVHS
jgi:hypothetical protein